MKKVLFIDDNHELRQITLEALELEGFKVMGAEDGRQGIEIAKKQLPDIILCDIMMPETDGFEVYSELRQYAPTSLTPFIFLTALAEKENLRKGMEIGADDYVTKPFTLAELLTTIYSRLIKSEVIETRIEVRQKELRERIINHLPHELLTPLNGILGFASL
ncbi:MAG: response regulator, partial [Bacteroidia bacterium]